MRILILIVKGTPFSWGYYFLASGESGYDSDDYVDDTSDDERDNDNEDQLNKDCEIIGI
jgi:hypothetical protein